MEQQQPDRDYFDANPDVLEEEEKHRQIIIAAFKHYR